MKIFNIYSNEKGMTIPELLIAMGLLTITLAGAFSLMQLSEANWNMSTNRMDARSDTSRKMSTIVRTIKNAEDPDSDKGLLDIADANNIVFYTNMDTDDEPEKVQYQVSGTDLIQTVTQPVSSTKPWVYTGTVESTTIADNLTNDASNPLFAYHIDGATVSLPASLDDCDEINEVEINLKTQTNNRGKSENISLETRVFLRNLREEE
jgi:type II secretory pathway pseudopilin PulG